MHKKKYDNYKNFVFFLLINKQIVQYLKGWIKQIYMLHCLKNNDFTISKYESYSESYQ